MKVIKNPIFEHPEEITDCPTMHLGTLFIRSGNKTTLNIVIDKADTVIDGYTVGIGTEIYTIEMSLEEARELLIDIDSHLAYYYDETREILGT